MLNKLLTLAQDEEEIRYVLRGLTVPQLRRLERAWTLWAHRGQSPPKGVWRVWLMLAGRGFGKTRAGAEWVSQLAREDGGLRIALVGGTIDEVANVMIRGQSGLMAVARVDEELLWVPSTRTLTFPNGAQAFAYSGERPDKLRGPEHHYAWCDELAKWAHPQETWDNLMLGLRLGRRPRVLVTTTPRPIALVRALAEDPTTARAKRPGADAGQSAFARHVRRRRARALWRHAAGAAGAGRRADPGRGRGAVDAGPGGKVPGQAPPQPLP